MNATRPLQPDTLRDLRTLARFISLYCRTHHHDRPAGEVQLKTHDVQAIAGSELHLCPDCARLLAHAFVKRSVCPMHPKPACKHCPKHCYAPQYRQQIRQVMKSSGMRMLLTGRIDYLWHMFF